MANNCWPPSPRHWRFHRRAWPEVPRERKPDPESTGIVELLQAVLKARAAEEGIAPTMLATSSDLQTLVEAKQNRTALDVPILRGWRRQLAGDLLLQVLDGAVTITVDRIFRCPPDDPGTSLEGCQADEPSLTPPMGYQPPLTVQKRP